MAKVVHFGGVYDGNGVSRGHGSISQNNLTGTSPVLFGGGGEHPGSSLWDATERILSSSHHLASRELQLLPALLAPDDTCRQPSQDLRCPAAVRRKALLRAQILRRADRIATVAATGVLFDGLKGVDLGIHRSDAVILEEAALVTSALMQDGAVHLNPQGVLQCAHAMEVGAETDTVRFEVTWWGGKIVLSKRAVTAIADHLAAAAGLLGASSLALFMTGLLPGLGELGVTLGLLTLIAAVIIALGANGLLALDQCHGVKFCWVPALLPFSGPWPMPAGEDD